MDDADDLDLWAEDDLFDLYDDDPLGLGADWTDGDYASASGRPAPPPNQGLSGKRLQLRAWTNIERSLTRWGVDPRTIREDQAQVVPGRGKGGAPLIQRNNQPDVQAASPKRGPMINVEADTTRKKASVMRELRRSHRNDPTARVAGVLYHPTTGKPVKTIYWDPQRRRFGEHDGGLRRSDVLSMEF
jgi:hypothetical protein